MYQDKKAETFCRIVKRSRYSSDKSIMKKKFVLQFLLLTHRIVSHRLEKSIKRRLCIFNLLPLIILLLFFF